MPRLRRQPQRNVPIVRRDERVVRAKVLDQDLDERETAERGGEHERGAAAAGVRAEAVGVGAEVEEGAEGRAGAGDDGGEERGGARGVGDVGGEEARGDEEAGHVGVGGADGGVQGRDKGALEGGEVGVGGGGGGVEGGGGGSGGPSGDGEGELGALVRGKGGGEECGEVVGWGGGEGGVCWDRVVVFHVFFLVVVVWVRKMDR